MAERALDIENIGRIGQIFIDGDLLKDIFVDRFTWDEDDMNYNIPAFNTLKKTLMKIERLAPELDIYGVIWYWYTANRLMAAPAVAGRNMPKEGWIITLCDPLLHEAMTRDLNTRKKDEGGGYTYYFPIKTSAGDIVGALQLTEGKGADI